MIYLPVLCLNNEEQFETINCFALTFVHKECHCKVDVTSLTTFIVHVLINSLFLIFFFLRKKIHCLKIEPKQSTVACITLIQEIKTRNQ